MHTIDYHIDLVALFIFLGIGQGLYVSAILLFKKKNRNKANFYLSLFLLVLALLLIDIFLSYTRLILKAIFLFDFSGSLIFMVGPLLYLYFRHLMVTNGTKSLPHFIIFIFYFIYSLFYLSQSADVKYNIYVFWYDLHLPPAGTLDPIWDPLHIKQYYITAAILHFSVYFILTLVAVIKYFQSNKYSFFACESNQVRWLRDFLLMFFVSILVTAVLKYTGTLSTTNYMVAAFLTIFIYFISFRFAFNPDIININPLDSSLGKKYNKSALSDEMKQELLLRIKKVMEEEKIFRDNLLSLTRLSSKICASSNHISQVINECLDQSFYEMLANYRIKEATELLSEHTNYTIDEIANLVGYNSRAAFNNAFKKITGKTPSEYGNSMK
jgi:AraC-like DNA-binding protein